MKDKVAIENIIVMKIKRDCV